MTDISITAERDQCTYVIDVDLNDHVFDIKWDTGAADTVISIGAIFDGMTPEKLLELKVLCESHSKPENKKRFVSASGDEFWGYHVDAHDAVIGGQRFPRFHYYLVLENKRDIALLGFDFVDRCGYKHDPEGDVVITEFKDDGYGAPVGVMDNNELISFIDSFE